MSTKDNNILIIDDDNIFADFLAEILSEYCTKVYTAQTIEKAKSLFYQYDFKIVFLDINLKGRNGAEVLKFLVENPLNANSKAKFIIMSGMIEENFIEKNKNRFYAIVKKPFEVEDVIDLVKKNIDSTKEETYLNDIPVVYCEKPFPAPDLQDLVFNFLLTLKPNSKLRNLLTELKNLNSDELVILDQAGKIINVAFALALKLDWNKENLIEKIVLASYLHNFVLKNKPFLLKFNSFEDINANQKELGMQNYFQTINHSENMVKMLQGVEDIPSDVLDMIKNHHELPNGKGFPQKLDHHKLSATSALFIVAHDIVHYSEGRPNWTIADYLNERSSFFQGTHFKKIAKAIELLKGQ